MDSTLSVDERSIRAQTLSLHITVAINAMGFSFMLPLLPFLARDLHATPVEIGILISCYPVAQLIMSPVYGRLSDVYGRKTIIAASLLLGTVSAALMGLAPTFVALLVARTLHGIVGAGIAPVARAAAADLHAGPKTSVAMAHMGAWSQAGQVVGPLLASALVVLWSNRAPFFVAALLSLGNYLLTSRTLSFDRPQKKAEIKERQHQFSWQNFVVLLLVLFAWQLTISIAAVAFPLFIHDVLGLRDRHIGYFSAVGAASLALTQAILTKPIVERLGDGKTIMLGLTILACMTVAIPFSPTAGLVMMVYAVWMIGTALARSTTHGALTHVSPYKNGVTMGIAQMADNTGRIIGPTLGGWLYAYGPKMPFKVADCVLIFLLIVCAFFLRLPGHAKHVNSPSA